MNTTVLMTLIIGLVVGATGALGIPRLTNSSQDQPADTLLQTTPSTDHSAMSMADMNTELAELSGDEFDRLFIELMIVHHEGAVDMAELAKSRARHEEILTLSEAIISAQTQEIAEMKQWYDNWGYSTDGLTPMIHEAH